MVLLILITLVDWIRDTTNSKIKCFFGNVRFYYCRMHPEGHFLFLWGRGGVTETLGDMEMSRDCHLNVIGHENHFPKFKLHWFKLYPLIIDTQSWQFWSRSFIYMTNFQYIYIYIYICLIYLWRKVVCFVLCCFAVMRSTKPGCFRSCSGCVWKALDQKGCMGLVQKFLNTEWFLHWKLN